MTLASTTAAARRRAPLWGITRYRTATGPYVELPVSWEELDRDTEWARAMLSTLPLTPGQFALTIARVEQSPWMAPFQRASTELGAGIAISDAFRADGSRVAAYLTRLPISVVLGLDADVLGGLEEDRSISLFQRVPFVYCHPRAYRVLMRAGVRPLLWLPLGPALGLECPARMGAHVNRAEWLTEEIDGEVHVTSFGSRAHRVQREPTGIAATVIQGRCSCGSHDPRVVVPPGAPYS